MFEIFRDLTDRIDAAKPVLHHGVKRADYYACRIIDLLEEIAGHGDPAEDQRVKRVSLVNGTPVEIEIPPGEDWKLVSMIVEPAAATTVTLSLGNVRRFAKNFAVADTPVIEGIVVTDGTVFIAQSTGADATLTIIARVKRARPRKARGQTGDELVANGAPAQHDADPERHFTDEATQLPPTITSEEELHMAHTAPEPDRNGYEL